MLGFHLLQLPEHGPDLAGTVVGLGWGWHLRLVGLGEAVEVAVEQAGEVDEALGELFEVAEADLQPAPFEAHPLGDDGEADGLGVAANQGAEAAAGGSGLFLAHLLDQTRSESASLPKGTELVRDRALMRFRAAPDYPRQGGLPGLILCYTPFMAEPQFLLPSRPFLYAFPQPPSIFPPEEREAPSRPANLVQGRELRRSRQRVLFCRCGSSSIWARGLCQRCYSRERADQKQFSGLRERVLERDGHTCRGCGATSVTTVLAVHHRQPGVSSLDLLVTLCPACHAMVERTRCFSAMGPNCSGCCGASFTPRQASSCRSLLLPAPMTALVPVTPAAPLDWLRAMVLAQVASPHSKHNYAKAFDQLGKFLAGEPLSRASLLAYRSQLIERELSAIRKLVAEARRDRILDSETAASIADVPNIRQQGTRMGNWLNRDQAKDLLAVPTVRG